MLDPMLETQELPVRMFRSLDTLTVAAPMAGLGVDDIAVEVTEDGRLVLDGRLCQSPRLECGELGSHKDVLLDEWTVGPYHREIRVGVPVDGPGATVTFGNGVLVVALPITNATKAARLTLEPVGPARGERRPG
jgi:HSP20 family molecular chaperone IbpA